MTIGAPLGLLALAGVPVLVAAYLLRRRNPPRRVSALFLWRATDEIVPAGPKLHRLQREWSLVLELLAVLAATVFLADVRFFPRDASAMQVVLVVDGGLSMRARGSDGRTSAERVRARAKSLLAGADVATIVETGARPRVLAGPNAPVDEALAKLARWSPWQPSHAYAPALALARELAGARGVTFLTDAMPTEALPQNVAIEALGESLPNVAFASATRTDSATTTRLRLRVLNASPTTTAAPLEVRDERGALVTHRDLSLAPGETQALTLDLPRARTLSVALPDDALVDDSRLTLLPNPELPVFVRDALDATSPEGAAVARVLAAMSDVHVGEPASLTFARPSPRSEPWTVTLGVTGGAKQRRSFVGPFFTDHRSPLFDDVGLDGVVWTAGANPPGEPLVTAGDRVLVSREDGPRFHFNLDLSRSNVQRTTAWPVLMTNLVELRRASLPGFVEHDVTIGSRVPMDVDGSDSKLVGDTSAIALAQGRQEAGPLPPGTWKLMRGGDERDRLSVLAIDPRESDLRAKGSGHRAAAQASTTLVEPSRARWPLWLLLALLLADFTLAAPGARRAFAKAAP